MADAPDIPRPSQLWKQLPAEKKRMAAEAFWRDSNAMNEQAEAIGQIANRIKFRLKSVIAMPIEKKAQYVVSMPAVSEILAARLLVAYHLMHQRPMMGTFLDALGDAHEDGIINDEEMKAPSAEALEKAAGAIAAAYPADDVALYLSTLTWQDPDTWGGLTALPQTRVA
jgi:hypothetical protein